MKRSAVISRALLLLALASLVVCFYVFDIGHYLTLSYFQTQHEYFRTLYETNTAAVISIYFAIYVAVTALSLPGATLMTLAGGAIFGLSTGVLIVSFASTIGATLAFLVSRFLLRDFVENKFRERVATVNRGINKDGAFYLFTLRLLPIFPFFVVNLVMGLTQLPVSLYYIISQIGMLPATIVYVNAGTQIAKIDSFRGIMNPSLFFSFALLGLLPLFAKRLIQHMNNRKHLKRFNKPKRFDYDIVVIGAGSAGLVTSYIGAAVKAKVALIEKHKMGGDCLNTGCVPSKALIRSSKIFNYIRRAPEFGIQPADAKVDFPKVMERVQTVIRKIEPHDSVERYTQLGVECIQGQAYVVSPYEVDVGDRKLTTRNIVVATGARPLVPDLPGLDLIPYYTSDTVWSLREKPRHMVILGGGPIGCELAQAFSRLGIQITLVEKNERLLRGEDEVVSLALQKKFASEDLTVLTGHQATAITAKGHQRFVVVKNNGSEKQIECDALLIALGRKPNTSGFGLEELGIGTNSNGTIESDEYLKTIYPNIFVCGDVAGPFQLTHAASHQAWYAAVNALFRPFKQFRADYRVIPWCAYTSPEVARVGLSEQEAKAKGIPYVLSEYSIDDLDRAICDSEDNGFVRVLTSPGTDKIIGVTIMGHHAGDWIAEFVLAMKHGIGLNKILGTIHIYPTFAEANKYVAGVWKRQTAPTHLLKWIERFHAFRRG